jgi:hypothetical protein
MRKLLLILVLPVFLAACGAEPKWASDDAIQSVAYHHPGPTTLTFFTVINNRSNAGAHLGLMVNASQRVLFDPAGTWWNPAIPERNDVHYGISPRVLDNYIDYHTRENFDTVIQTIQVSPEVAEMALREVQAYGAVPKAYCTKSITEILSHLPGFENIKSTFYPKKAMADLATYSGMTQTTIYDKDISNGTVLVAH